MTRLTRESIEVVAWLWIGCTAVYFLTAPGRIDMIDGGIRFDVTESIIEVGRPIVRQPRLPAIPGRDGLRYSFYPLGTSLIGIPFVRIGGWLGGESLEAKQFAFSLASVPFASGVIALLFLIWRRLGFSRSTAVWWSLVVAFCTPLWPYAGSSFDTAIQAFWLTLAVWAAVEAMGAGSRNWAVLSGAAFAVFVNIQEIYAALGVCVFAEFPLRFRSLLRRAGMPVVQIIVLGLSSGVGLVLAYNTFKFGNPLATGRTTVPHPLIGSPGHGLVGLFLSPAKSILLYSPTYIFALMGLRRLVRSNRSLYGPLGACLALHVLLTASLRFWAGEWAWGPRYLIVSLPLACIGLPFVTGTRMRAALAATACAGFVVQLLAISVDHQRYYFERSLPPFFWVDERSMYTDSPLFARPGELMAVLRHEDLDKVRALVPARDPMSMTSSLFGPSGDRRNDIPTWMREYLVFLVPRPWPLWSRYLPPHLRPGRTDLMTIAGACVALAAFSLLAFRLRTYGRRDIRMSAVAETNG